jgi:hypothetical protein
MAFYAYQMEEWTRVPSRPEQGRYIHVPDDLLETPAVAFADGAGATYTLEGVRPAPGAETVHTVARIDPATMAGTLLCAYSTEDGTETLLDLRSDNGEGPSGDVVAGIEEALDEILIPVYIDDAVCEGTEEVDALIALLTVQPETGEPASSYARVAVFQNGELLLEEEAGAL